MKAKYETQRYISLHDENLIKQSGLYRFIINPCISMCVFFCMKMILCEESEIDKYL